MHLHDPLEGTIPAAGLLTVEDAETGELLELDTNRAAVRAQFARTNNERLRELDRATADHDRAPGLDPFAVDPFFDLVLPENADMMTSSGFYSSGYANVKTILTLEARVRDLAGNQGVWSAGCNATLGEDADRLAVLHRFADRLVHEMSQAGVIR